MDYVGGTKELARPGRVIQPQSVNEVTPGLSPTQTLLARSGITLYSKASSELAIKDSLKEISTDKFWIAGHSKVSSGESTQKPLVLFYLIHLLNYCTSVCAHSGGDQSSASADGSVSPRRITHNVAHITGSDP